MNVVIELGSVHHSMDFDHLPPIGTKISVHKHLMEDGCSAMLEVTGHDWRIEDADSEGNAFVCVTIRTRKIPR